MKSLGNQPPLKICPLGTFKSCTHYVKCEPMLYSRGAQPIVPGPDSASKAVLSDPQDSPWFLKFGIGGAVVELIATPLLLLSGDLYARSRGSTC